MSRPIPLTKSQKRAVIAATLTLSFTFSFSVSFVESFGTWNFPEIPSISQLIGFLLIGFLSVSAGALVIFRMSSEENLRVANPLSKLPLVIEYGGIGVILFLVDLTLFSGQGTTRITSFSVTNQALISLLLSALLVLLYYDQHQTQRQQVEIMSQQVNLEERQIEWQEKQRAPQVDILQWEFLDLTKDSKRVYPDGTRGLRDLASTVTKKISPEQESVVFTEVENTGKTPAQNLNLRIETLVTSPSLPEGYHDISLLVRFRTSRLIDIRNDSLYQYLNHQQVE